MAYHNYEKFNLDLFFEEDSKSELSFNKTDIYTIIDVFKYQNKSYFAVE